MRNKTAIAILILGIGLGTLVSRTVPSSVQQSVAESQSAIVSESVPEISATSPLNDAEKYYPVTKVVDGDTIAVEMGGKSETVRLIGLDTPETVDPRKPVQCFGEEASKKAKEILTGRRVRIEMDASQGSPTSAEASAGTRDKYGRLLAYIFLEDGTLFNKLMIAEGFGHEYTYNLPYKYQKEFKEAEKTARENKKGLWADFACTSESERPNKSADTENTPVPYPVRSSQIRNTGKYECAKNVYNCSSFKTQAEAQNVFELCGGNQNDVHKLDSDMDGKVCERLP